MEVALMYFRRGKIVANQVQRNTGMSLDTFMDTHPGRFATAEEIVKEKVEMPGPDFRLWKTSRGDFAVKETGPAPTVQTRFGK